MTLAKRIRDCRYEKGWGPDELAQRAEISRTALYQIECGKTETPRAGTLKRIARALDVPIERLLGVAVSAADPVSDTEAKDVFTDRAEPGGSGHASIDPARPPRDRYSATPGFVLRTAAASRETEILQKFQELLASPLGDGIGRIVEASHRLLPPLRAT
jgi:transcriptional regulator with XRE-family HTH domain